MMDDRRLLAQQILARVQADGWKVQYEVPGLPEWGKKEDFAFEHGPDGDTNVSTKVITIRPGQDTANYLHTVSHEWAHTKLHTLDKHSGLIIRTVNLCIANFDHFRKLQPHMLPVLVAEYEAELTSVAFLGLRGFDYTVMCSEYLSGYGATPKLLKSLNQLTIDVAIKMNKELLP